MFQLFNRAIRRNPANHLVILNQPWVGILVLLKVPNTEKRNTKLRSILNEHRQISLNSFLLSYSEVLTVPLSAVSSPLSSWHIFHPPSQNFR